MVIAVDTVHIRKCHGGMKLTDNHSKPERKSAYETRNYHTTKMQREKIIEALKDSGCRITKQRLTILDIILENECSCCKEMYFKATRMDDKIGTATVYRMVNTLEEIGAISRKNMYKVVYSDKCAMENACTVVLDDNTTYKLSAQKWNAIIRAGLSEYGYLKKKNIQSVTVADCECESSIC